MASPAQGIEVYAWNGVGYQPLVFSGDWQVALLNWEPLFSPAHLGEVERHSHTDEVFVLWKGQAALFVVTEDGIQLVEMQPGLVYNVVRGTWHNLVATPDASWVIVERRDTHLYDTETRRMTAEELAALAARLPAWVH